MSFESLTDDDYGRRRKTDHKSSPCHYVTGELKIKKPLISEHLLMGTTTKVLQSLGNYHDSILTTTMCWKLPHRTNGA